MKRVIGIVIGLLYLFISFNAFRTSAGGWNAGHSDIGFWWGVIAMLLGIAGIGAMVGSWLHTRPQQS